MHTYFVHNDVICIYVYIDICFSFLFHSGFRGPAIFGPCGTLTYYPHSQPLLQHLQTAAIYAVVTPATIGFSSQEAKHSGLQLLARPGVSCLTAEILILSSTTRRTKVKVTETFRHEMPLVWAYVTEYAPPVHFGRYEGQNVWCCLRGQDGTECPLSIGSTAPRP